MAFPGWLGCIGAAAHGFEAIFSAFDNAVAAGARAQMDFFNPEWLWADRIV